MFGVKALKEDVQSLRAEVNTNNRSITLLLKQSAMVQTQFKAACELNSRLTKRVKALELKSNPKQRLQSE